MRLGQMKIPHGHPWRVTLMRAHKSLLSTPLPDHLMEVVAVPVTRFCTWSALADDSAGPQVSESGEQVWGRYSIEGGSHGPWWEAVFRAEDVLVRRADGDTQAIPYEDMRRIELPEKKSPARRTESGIWHDESAVEGFSGKLYPIGAAAWPRRGDGIVVWRNIYCWHAIVLATYHDRKREGL